MASSMDRRRLSESVIERIRRERYAPRIVQCDYLHLRDVRAVLEGAFSRLTRIPGPVLDLFCGTQPYREMIPAQPVWGFDVDRHFGRVDIVGGLLLPFDDATFSLVLCTQALHLVEDPATTVREMARVLKPGGTAIVTVPHIFRKEIPEERHLSDDQLRSLFTGWEARIDGFGGRLSTAMYTVAGIHNTVARRWSALRFASIPLALIVNISSIACEALTGHRTGRFNASWLVVAARTKAASP